MVREELTKELRRYGLESGSTLGRHMGIMDEAADAIEELEKEVERQKDRLYSGTELEWLKHFVRESSFDDEVSRDQLRCLWTAFCLHYNFIVDTADYDANLRKLWEAVAETEEDTADWGDYESFDNYLAKYLC